MKDRTNEEMEILRTPLNADRTGIVVDESHVNADDFYQNRVHYHYFYELELFLSDDGIGYEINNVRFPLKVGALFLVTPADYHQCLSAPGDHLHYYNLQFPAAILSEEVNSALYSLPEPIALTPQDEDLVFFKNKLAELRSIYNKKADWYEPLLHAEIESLCIRILQRLPHPLSREGQDPVIKSALIYIKENYRHPLSLAQVAAQVQLSECYFSSRFSAVMQTGFSDYLRGFRLNAAANLLKSTNLTVSQVAYESGFQSPTYFSACFRSRFRLSPKEYQKVFRH